MFPIPIPRKNPRSPKRHAAYCIYIVECANGSFYAGYTRDINKRVALHNSGHGAKYLRGKLPVKLVFTKQYKYYKHALLGERQLKKFSKEQKKYLAMAYTAKLNLAFPLKSILRRYSSRLSLRQIPKV